MRRGGEKRWKQEKRRENGGDYEKRARMDGEKRWKWEKGTENGVDSERRARREERRGGV